MFAFAFCDMHFENWHVRMLSLNLAKSELGTLCLQFRLLPLGDGLGNYFYADERLGAVLPQPEKPLGFDKEIVSRIKHLTPSCL